MLRPGGKGGDRTITPRRRRPRRTSRSAKRCEPHPVTGGVAQAGFQVVDAIRGQAHPQRHAIGIEGFGGFARARRIERRVGIAEVPESVALRWRGPPCLHRIALADAWAVRQRYMLTREEQQASVHLQELMAAIAAHHGPDATGQ